MTHFVRRIRLFYRIFLIECLLFGMNLLVLFSTMARNSMHAVRHEANIEEWLFLLFYSAILIMCCWALSELVFPRNVELVNGTLLIKRGIIVSRKIPYGEIKVLKAQAVNIEKNRSGSLKTDVVARGEKLIIRAERNKSVVYSFQIDQYPTFKKKLIQLAVNAKIQGPRNSIDEVDYSLLIVGGMFLLVMTYVTFFK